HSSIFPIRSSAISMTCVAGTARARRAICARSGGSIPSRTVGGVRNAFWTFRWGSVPDERGPGTGRDGYPWAVLPLGRRSTALDRPLRVPFRACPFQPLWGLGRTAVGLDRILFSASGIRVLGTEKRALGPLGPFGLLRPALFGESGNGPF